MAEPLPLILTDCSIKIDTKDLTCVTNHIELSPDVSVTTIDTLCGSKDYAGVTKWSLILTLYQSFDALATEAVLSGAVAGGIPVAYEILPYKGKTTSATNPKFSGTVIPQPYSPINGDAGEASTIELEWSCVGAPTKAIV